MVPACTGPLKDFLRIAIFPEPLLATNPIKVLPHSITQSLNHSFTHSLTH